jgi:hypothetical protein
MNHAASSRDFTLNPSGDEICVMMNAYSEPLESQIHQAGGNRGGALLTRPKASLIGSSRIASGQSIRTITGLQLALSLCSCVRQRLEPLLR